MFPSVISSLLLALATALGMIGAKEYTPQLAAFPRRSNPFDRAGGALGLGALRMMDGLPSTQRGRSPR